MFSALVAFVATLSGADAQIGYLWAFDELTQKADLIVIAEWSATEHVRHTLHPGLKPDLPAIELTSSFKVLSVLKAASEPSDRAVLRLIHYQIDWDEWRRVHPALPGEPPPSVVNAGSSLDFRKNSGQYLLFLRHVRDGHYEPLSGHTFPTDSVYLLAKLPRRVG